MFFLMIAVLEKTEYVQASTYENAYTFYQAHGNEMVFIPGKKNEGEIYYATKGKKNVSSGIRYTTLGWKVRIFKNSGACVETIYYKLGGNYMTSVDVRTIDGYEYCLYRVTLENLKSRLSKAGLETLQFPDCDIVFDACISIKRNGKLEGGMTDQGISWGTVHTTYNGIANAEKWAKDTKESLKSYYNKMVKDLFYEVKIQKGKGVQQVSGEGRYCFGTKVNVSAVCEEGYHFSGWTGSETSPSETYSFILYGRDATIIANAKENRYRILFDSGEGNGVIPEQVLDYGEILNLPMAGTELEGASLSGWKLPAEKKTQIFPAGNQVEVKALVKYLGLERTDGATIVLHASWDKGPIIKTQEINVSLVDAISGHITEEWLAEKAEAYDLEDGEIPYGKNKRTFFFMKDYQATDFTELQEEGCVKKMFLAMDSAGNLAKKEIEIHVADTKIYPQERVFGRVRFISEKYFWDAKKNLINENQGGLAENSIWRWKEEYRKLLEKLFEEKRR